MQKYFPNGKPKKNLDEAKHFPSFGYPAGVATRLRGLPYQESPTLLTFRLGEEKNNPEFSRPKSWLPCWRLAPKQQGLQSARARFNSGEAFDAQSRGVHAPNVPRPDHHCTGAPAPSNRDARPPKRGGSDFVFARPIRGLQAHFQRLRGTNESQPRRLPSLARVGSHQIEATLLEVTLVKQKVQSTNIRRPIGGARRHQRFEVAPLPSTRPRADF